jgi:hypothetical protein
VLVTGAAASLASPNRVYGDLLKPSLVACGLHSWWSSWSIRDWAPAPAAGGRGRVALAGAGSALMLFGLWSTVVNQVAT